MSNGFQQIFPDAQARSSDGPQAEHSLASRSQGQLPGAAGLSPLELASYKAAPLQ
jgi:hypothetical protein